MQPILTAMMAIPADKARPAMTTTRSADRGEARRAAVLAAVIGLAVFACYNANGREIGSYDTQPTKYTTVQLVAHRSFNLDTVVGRSPALGERIGFAVARDGHVRSAYSVAWREDSIPRFTASADP
jgi:hypothetical protein